MNKDRRNQISALSSTLEQMRALLEETKESLEEVRNDEQDYFDNMPESLQDGADEAIAYLSTALEMLEEIDLGEVQSNLDMAAE